MARISKQFEAWVTGLKSNLFTWARLKLTALYLLIIVVILAAYSIGLYASLTRHIRNNIKSNTQDVIDLVDTEDLFATTTEHLQVVIFVIDTGVIIIAALLSYWLAGFTLRPIRAALEAQASFSADASHELRTPLAVMRSQIEVLLRSKQALDPEVRNVLESNLEEIIFLSTISEQLLELTRGHERSKPDFRPVNLTRVVLETLKKINPLALKSSIHINPQLQEHVYVLGLSDNLERVLRNLLTNAIVYNRHAGKVDITLTADSREIKLIIADTGVGIEEKDLPLVFNRFFKGDAARGSSVGGSGLGLAIVKQIIAEHKGSITITSELGLGTVVTSILPRTPHI